MTSSLPPASAPVIEPIGIPNAFLFASGLFASGLFASGPSATGERVWGIDDSGLSFEMGDFVTAVGANVLPARVLRPEDRAGRGRSMAFLDAVGLEDVGDQFPQELLGGRRSRVAAARAPVDDPAMLLVDEPCGEEIAAAILRPRHLEVDGGGAFGNHHRTIGDPDADAVAAAAGSTLQQENWR
jgi:hypothetical protein